MKWCLVLYMTECMFMIYKTIHCLFLREIIPNGMGQLYPNNNYAISKNVSGGGETDNGNRVSISFMNNKINIWTTKDLHGK